MERKFDFDKLNLNEKSIETQNLVLRRVTEDDHKDMYRYAKDPEIGPNAGWKPHESEEESLQIIKDVFLDSKTQFGIIDKNSGRMIGGIGASDITSRGMMIGDGVNIGYVLSREYWGRGYTLEATTALIDKIFENDLDFIIIKHYEKNVQSRRVIEKLGAICFDEEVETNRLGKRHVTLTYIIRKNWWRKGVGRIIDLRSDTVTQPTEKMRYLMASAPVGDDVYEDDPSLNALEKYAAELLQKEAALFVPSGTFANQLAIMTHTQRGDEVLIGDNSHILMHEVGAAAVISAVTPRTFFAPKGYVDIQDLELKIREDDIHHPRTGLICIENAHSSGAVQSIENMRTVYQIAKSHNIPVHLDGARLFNAAASLSAKAHELAAFADTINICLSKGLAAPVGSMLIGSKDFIRKARKNRKLMGGGLRQAGVLAAAAFESLKNMSNRIDTDNKNAILLAEELAKLPQINVIKDRLDINMVFFRLSESVVTEDDFIKILDDHGILSLGTEFGEYRFVVHYMVTEDDIRKVISAIKEALG